MGRQKEKLGETDRQTGRESRRYRQLDRNKRQQIKIGRQKEKVGETDRQTEIESRRNRQVASKRKQEIQILLKKICKKGENR